MRLASEFTPAEPSDDDLEALANVVREASKRRHLSTARVNKNWDGHLSPEATSGGSGHPGNEYDAYAKQGLNPPAPTSHGTTPRTFTAITWGITG